MHEARHGQPLSSELLLLVGAGEGTPVLPASGEQQRRPIGVVLADEASSVAAKPAAGSRWCFSDAVESDPAGRDFARSTDCCTLRWTPAKGRHATATREISRGRVILRASAAAVASTAASGAATALLAESSGRDGAAASADAQRVGLDASTLALSLELLRSGREAAEEAAGSLLTHREHLSAAEAEAWERTAQRLRSAAASSGGSGCSCASGWSDEAVLRLLLAVHANAHPVLDDATASRTVGLGLFPAACLLNHSCAPTGVLSFEAGGKVLVVRALVDLRRGQEVTYSYLDEPHLFAPWRQRRALLRAAHRYEPSQPRSREESEAAALCRSRLPAAALGELEAEVRALCSEAAAAAEEAEEAAARGDGPLAPSAEERLGSACEAVHSLLEGRLLQAAPPGPAGPDVVERVRPYSRAAGGTRPPIAPTRPGMSISRYEHLTPSLSCRRRRTRPTGSRMTASPRSPAPRAPSATRSGSRTRRCG
uniref:SET domain-containing protein n=1 Tax=Emiliania huxleyi TaxID=2903 RepID=A0A7S3SWV2_EMIHU